MWAVVGHPKHTAADAATPGRGVFFPSVSLPSLPPVRLPCLVFPPSSIGRQRTLVSVRRIVGAGGAPARSTCPALTTRHYTTPCISSVFLAACRVLTSLSRLSILYQCSTLSVRCVYFFSAPRAREALDLSPPFARFPPCFHSRAPAVRTVPYHLLWHSRPPRRLPSSSRALHPPSHPTCKNVFLLDSSGSFLMPTYQVQPRETNRRTRVLYTQPSCFLSFLRSCGTTRNAACIRTVEPNSRRSTTRRDANWETRSALARS